MLPVIYRLGLVWGCCGLALAACTKPHQGGSLPPAPRPTASASASPTPSPTQSTTPAGDRAAIVALARRYYAESNVAIVSGRTSALRDLVIAGCPCNGFADRVEADWRKGRVVSPRYYAVVSVGPAILRTSTAASVTVFYRVSAYAVFDRTGARIQFVPADGQTHSASVECAKVGAQWKVTDVIRL